MNRTEFRNQLIPQTIANASSLAFYRDIWKNHDPTNVHSVDDLRHLPLVTKPMYRERGENNVEHLDALWTITHSTGTTGRVTLRYHSQDERDFLWEFFGSANERQAESKPQAKPLILEIGTPFHGGPLHVPTPGVRIQGGVDNESRLGQTMTLLKHDVGIPGYPARVNTLSATPGDVELLLLAMLAAGDTPSSYGIEHLLFTGEALSAATREWFETQLPNVEITERYSLSEIFGGATRHRACGNYHFDPHVVPEVVDSTSLSPVSSGIGVMVLTELYPFRQAQPLIRYVTGDVVAIVDSDCPQGKGYEVLGRESDVVLMEIDGLQTEVLSSRVIASVLERSPDVQRSDRFRHVSSRDCTSVGRARYILEVDQAEPCIELTLRMCPVFDADRYQMEADRRAGQIREDLVRASPGLAAALSSGLVNLRLAWDMSL